MTKKVIALVLALIMIFACAVPAMALNDTSATFQQVALANAPSVSGQFYVTLSINGDIVDNDGPISRYYYVVPMGAPNAQGVYYVKDVLEAAESLFTWLSFNYSHHGFDPQPLNYVNAVYDSGVSTMDFAPITEVNYRNGWMFRVNGKYRILDPSDAPSGWDESLYGKPGATITQAYVQAGDHIDLYFANTVSSTKATKSVILEGYSLTSSTLTLRGYKSYSYYNSSNKWIIYNYSVITNKTFTFKLDGVTMTKTFSSTGLISFDLTGLSTGTHTIEMMPTYNSYNYVDESNVSHTCQFMDYQGTIIQFTL